jgi:hypothetical protein
MATSMARGLATSATQRCSTLSFLLTGAARLDPRVISVNNLFQSDQREGPCAAVATKWGRLSVDSQKIQSYTILPVFHQTP